MSLAAGRRVPGTVWASTVDPADRAAQVRLQVVQGIRRWLGSLLPATGQVRVRSRWCCFRPATADGQPVIDRVPGFDNAWVSAGHDGDQPREVASFGLSRFDGPHQDAGRGGGPFT